MKQIEADVVIELWNDDNGTGEIFPIWECDSTFAQLRVIAAQLSLSLSEHCGGGSTTYVIHDFRDKNHTDEA